MKGRVEMVKRTLVAAMGIVAIVTGLVRPAEANVFDDAVFWFRGGKDRVTVNGQLERGEFFDDMHADDPAHTNHSLAVVGYPENITFRTEPVVFPALGLSVTQDLQVLHIDDLPHISADGLPGSIRSTSQLPNPLLHGLRKVERFPSVMRSSTRSIWCFQTPCCYQGNRGTSL